MVRSLIFWLLIPAFLFSGEFVANVTRNQINVGDSFSLTLTLTDASAQSIPSFDVLKKDFVVSSQQQSVKTVFMNGHMSAHIIWKVVLTPQKEGEITIPAINIYTSEGILSSEPIKITVVKGSSSQAESAEEMTFTADVSQSKPYKSEPFFLTVRLTTKLDVANVHMEKFNIEDAIVEQNGEPKVYKKISGGVKENLIEFNYLVTPLKAGALKIPSLIVQGGIPVKRKSLFRSSLFDDDESLFLSNFSQLKPFVRTTEERVIDIQAPIASLQPWLPAKSIILQETWDDSQTLQVGEPFSRGFKIMAEGVTSSQLPSLNDLQTRDKNFKIYADKPEVGDTITKEAIRSFRNEQFTLIPQQAGSLTLPEISLTWWDVTKKEKVHSHIPSRTLQILPAPESTKNAPAPLAEEKALTQEPSLSSSNVYLLYALIGLAVLITILLIAILYFVAKPKRIPQPSPPPTQPEKAKLTLPVKKKSNREKLPDLNPT